MGICLVHYLWILVFNFPVNGIMWRKFIKSPITIFELKRRDMLYRFMTQNLYTYLRKSQQINRAFVAVLHLKVTVMLSTYTKRSHLNVSSKWPRSTVWLHLDFNCHVHEITCFNYFHLILIQNTCIKAINTEKQNTNTMTVAFFCSYTVLIFATRMNVKLKCLCYLYNNICCKTTCTSMSSLDILPRCFANLRHQLNSNSEF